MLHTHTAALGHLLSIPIETLYNIIECCRRHSWANCNLHSLPIALHPNCKPCASHCTVMSTEVRRQGSPELLQHDICSQFHPHPSTTAPLSKDDPTQLSCSKHRHCCRLAAGQHSLNCMATEPWQTALGGTAPSARRLQHCLRGIMPSDLGPVKEESAQQEPGCAVQQGCAGPRRISQDRPCPHEPCLQVRLACSAAPLTGTLSSNPPTRDARLCKPY